MMWWETDQQPPTHIPLRYISPRPHFTNRNRQNQKLVTTTDIDGAWNFQAMIWHWVTDLQAQATETTQNYDAW